MKSISKLLIPLALVTFGVVGGAVAQDAFPSKPVSLIVPYPAGGLSDVIARKVNASIGKALAQAVIVENIGGGSGSIAAQKVLNSPSDGYLVFQGSPNELILAPLAISSIKYKSEDFKQIQRIAIAPMAIFARKDLAANNADELSVLAVKSAKEGKPLTYASVGNGSFYHLLGEQMSKLIGASMTHVPYKGAADVQRDLLGGQVDIFISPYGAQHAELAASGKIKFVAALSKERHRLLPNVPSVDESKALKGFHYAISTGYFVKRDTPEAIVNRLHQAISAALADSEVKTSLTAIGLDMGAPLSPAEAATDYAREADNYRAIAKAINLQAQ